MCKASIDARYTREAVKGDKTILDVSPYGFPKFQRPEDGSGQNATVTCAKLASV